jgi:hypothetical protein
LILGIFILIGVGGVILFSERNVRGAIPTDTAIPATLTAGEPVEEGDPYNLDVQLSEGRSGPQTVEALSLVTGEPLSAEAIEQILARLPALPPDSAGQADFNLPTESLPPPRTGETIQETFPPLETEAVPGEVESGPLHVLRFAPEGDVPIAPFVSVTFNQPMVPLGTLGDLAAADVPLSIEPALAGTWRWLGTRTLTFEYDSELFDRMPMATEYQLTVPAGTKSASGETLAEAITWTFTTPPPKVVSTYPDFSPQPLEPILFVEFDQRIDPATVLETIQVMAGGENVEIVLATRAEIEEDERISQWAKNAEEGCWLAFRAVRSFPTDTNITVTIGPGTPSAEGPLTTTEIQSYSF